MGQKSNLLFLPSWYPQKDNPGLGIFIKRQAIALSKMHNIFLIYTHSLRETKYELTYSNQNGFHEYIVSFPKSENPFTTLIRKRKAFKMAWEKIHSTSATPFDLVHLHVILPAAFLLLWNSHLREIPLIISEHWTGYTKADGLYKGALLKWITKKTVRQAKKTIVVSKEMQSAMESHQLKSEYFLIGNSVDTQVFTYAPIQNKNRLVHISTLIDRQKNITNLLHGFKKAQAKHPSAELVIIGNSEERGHFEQLAAKLGLSINVIFRGFLEEKQIAQELYQCSGLIITSHFEGLPCVILEALCCGRPVISTPVGEIPSVINKNNGLLLKDGSVLSITQGISSFLENTTFDYKAIHRAAVATYSNETIASEINQVYQETLSE